MDVLIIGGTRNLGHLLSLKLLESGHRVTVFNRGQTADELPADVQRVHGDRTDPVCLAQALAGKSFDVVVDTTLYSGAEAHAIAQLLDGRVGHYIVLSTGQVYLVRVNLPRPFVEDGYEGPLMTAPPPGTRDHGEWTYGVEKRRAEDALARAWETRRFPVTTLRLPMVNSERDHFHRIYGYLLRLQDGGPILIPRGAHLPVRHVYGGDVVRAIMALIGTGLGKGRAYNISQDETLPVEDFLELLGRMTEYPLRVARMDKALLESCSLMPDCSPFSDPWMSELDNRRSKVELGMTYTSLPIYLQRLIDHYKSHPPPTPEGYRRRREEIALSRGAESWGTTSRIGREEEQPA